MMSASSGDTNWRSWRKQPEMLRILMGSSESSWFSETYCDDFEE